MALFDFLSGTDEAEQARLENERALATYGATVNPIYSGYGTTATGAIRGGEAGALSSLGTGLTGGLTAQEAALRELQGLSTDPLQQAIRAYQLGVSGVDTSGRTALEAGQAGVAAFNPLRDLGASYQPAIDAYYRSLGLAPGGTPEFQAGPGYQFAVDEATRNALAKASAIGGLGGNTYDAITRLAGNLATGEYGNWQNRLAGFLPLQASAVSGAATGTAGAYRTLADIARGTGLDLATAYGNLAGGYGNLFTGERARAGDIAGAYGNVAGVYGTYAPLMASTQYGAGGDVANIAGNVAAGQAQTARDVTQGQIAANQQVAQAGQTDAANLWGLLGAGVKAAGAAYGGKTV